MNYLHLLSWYYQGASGKTDAREFFGKLEAGTKKGMKFPLDCPFEVALVHCTVDDHWCVGVLVMPETAGDDSIEQSSELNKWYQECGAKPIGTDNETIPAQQISVEGALQSRYGSHYRSVETFGINGSKKIADKFEPTSNTSPVMKCRNCGVETQAGNTYQFYYGKLVGLKTSYGNANTIRTVSQYNIVGPQHAYLCNKCVATQSSKDSRRNGIVIVVAAVFLFLVSIWSYLTDNYRAIGIIALLLSIFGVAFAFLFFQKWRVISKQLEQDDSDSLEELANADLDAGDILAYKIHERENPELLKQGTRFWTRESYKRQFSRQH